MDPLAGAIRLLVVDDDEVDRMAVHRALRGTGMDAEIVDAGTVAQAVELLRSQPFDCALVDYNLPDGEGVQVLAEAAALREAVPTIMLTGQGDEGLAVDLMKEGASDYIPKASLSPGRLSQSLRHVVEVARAEREARRARRSQELIMDVSAQLAQSLDFVGTAERLTRSVVPELADYAVLFLEEEGAVRRAAAAHIDPTLEDGLRAGPPLPVRENDPMVELLRAGQPVLVSDVDEGWLDAHSHDAAHRELTRRLGPRSVLVVPLVARGRTLGALLLAYSISERRYTENEVPTALNLASRGALALDNARLFQDLGDEMRLVETLNAFGNRVTAELNLEAVLRFAAEEAAAQTGAEFGVFAYRPPDDQGEEIE